MLSHENEDQFAVLFAVVYRHMFLAFRDEGGITRSDKDLLVANFSDERSFSE